MGTHTPNTHRLSCFTLRCVCRLNYCNEYVRCSMFDYSKSNICATYSTRLCSVRCIAMNWCPGRIRGRRLCCRTIQPTNVCLRWWRAHQRPLITIINHRSTGTTTDRGSPSTGRSCERIHNLFFILYAFTSVFYLIFYSFY